MQPDTIVINGKLRLSLTEVLPLDAPEWLEHTINSSTAVSNIVIQQIYSKTNRMPADKMLKNLKRLFFGQFVTVSSARP